MNKLEDHTKMLNYALAFNHRTGDSKLEIYFKRSSQLRKKADYCWIYGFYFSKAPRSTPPVEHIFDPDNYTYSGIYIHVNAQKQHIEIT